MHPLPTGQLAWYVTGRFYLAETSEATHDVGYFLHLQGLDANLFCAEPGEASAYFTFSANPFFAQAVSNADIALSLDPVGDFSVYFNPQPGAADFSDPSSFAVGEKIAVFRRAGMVVGATVGETSINVFSAELVASREFEFRGRRHDFKHLLPHGVTQWGTASTQAVSAPAPGYRKSIAFVGSAVAIGK